MKKENQRPKCNLTLMSVVLIHVTHRLRSHTPPLSIKKKEKNDINYKNGKGIIGFGK